MRHSLLVAASTIALVAAPLAWAAPVGSLSANWYVLQPGHVDTQVDIPGPRAGLVATSLSGGAPVRATPPGATSGPNTPVGSANDIRDIDSAGRILWWTPGARATGTVVADTTYPTTVAIPFSAPANLFPAGGPSNGGTAGFLAAHLFGTFTAPEGGSITIRLGADDDAWVFINNTLVLDLGGVKALNTSPVTVTDLQPGLNRIDVFWADRHTVQAGLEFSADVRLNAVPAPAALGLFGLALAGLVAARRRGGGEGARPGA